MQFPAVRIRTVQRRLALALTTIVAASVVGAVGIVTPAHASSRCVDNVYGYGGYSTCVGYIQTLLNWFKIGPDSTCGHPVFNLTPLTVDNSFGTKTRSATIYFQRYFCLGVDGYVGPQTWRVLCGPSRARASPVLPVGYRARRRLQHLIRTTFPGRSLTAARTASNPRRSR